MTDQPLPHWAREFSASYQVPSIISHALDDCSWHNDACPSFGMNTGEGTDVKIWVEHPDPDMRETGSRYRYAVNVHNWDTEVNTDLLETDDPELALATYRKAVENV